MGSLSCFWFLAVKLFFSVSLSHDPDKSGHRTSFETWHMSADHVISRISIVILANLSAVALAKVEAGSSFCSCSDSRLLENDSIISARSSSCFVQNLRFSIDTDKRRWKEVFRFRHFHPRQLCDSRLPDFRKAEFSLSDRAD